MARDNRKRAHLLEDNEEINWHHIASHIPGRNNKDCRKRWIYALMPSLNKGAWSEEEDALLREGVRLHGFKLVSRAPIHPELFGGRQLSWDLFSN
jgi:Myb-like DNA-binding domain